MKPADLPDWPRGLNVALAAAYVGLSPGTFRKVVAPEVPAVRLSPGRLVWLRDQLDRWLDKKSGAEPANPWHQDEPDPPPARRLGTGARAGIEASSKPARARLPRATTSRRTDP